ncbi:GspH/FimT family pseudopilin [Luteimonas sp. MC1782]|uniref:GspH/FimT family pseudopilin n=1 Tax=Luteimonas sp. MC1782 TaxID=2760305 RepID=UPI001602E45F|nr:GspH/FimT family pseudopilin [Luteimonas sp. MC1782]MBB1472613.1 GspH/FimT family pseudopilin [Luteimonas sp. MC1782]
MTRKVAGFTLIEAVVSLSVLSALAAIGLPSLTAFLEHQRTAAAMSSLVSQMSHARLAAVKYRHPTVLCPTVDGEHCLPGGDWTNGWMIFISRDKQLRPIVASDLLHIDLSPGNRNLRLYSSGRTHLRYLPDGRSAGTNLTINICDRQGQRLGAVIVNNVGRPRIERGPAGTACLD